MFQLLTHINDAHSLSKYIFSSFNIVCVILMLGIQGKFGHSLSKIRNFSAQLLQHIFYGSYFENSVKYASSTGHSSSLLSAQVSLLSIVFCCSCECQFECLLRPLSLSAFRAYVALVLLPSLVPASIFVSTCKSDRTLSSDGVSQSFRW